MTRKRTAITVNPKQKTAPVITLSIDDMVAVSNNGSTFYLKRLRYVGVPNLSSGGGFNSNDLKSAYFKVGTDLRNAGRDDAIRGIYEDTKGASVSLFGAKDGLVSYFRYLDGTGYSADVFSLPVMIECIKYYNELALKGDHVNRASSIRKALSFVLKAAGRNADVYKLPPVFQQKSKGVFGGALDIETELKPIARILRKGYESFVRHIKEGTLPDVHPFYSKEKVNERARIEGWGIRKLANLKTGYSRCLKLEETGLKMVDPPNQRLVINHAVDCAVALIHMLTGMNTSVMANITFSDVTFKGIGGGRYVLSGLKGRAGNKELDNSLGFSKLTKKIIEDWLIVSKIIYTSMGFNVSDNTFIFPFFSELGKVFNRSSISANKVNLNHRIEPMVGFKVNPSRFRKTKADIMMRATEDIYLVSQALNNTIKVVQKEYTSGNNTHIDKQLGAVMNAQMSISKGKGIAESVEEAKVLFSDILSEYDYKERLSRNEIPATTITPTGLRCAGGKKNKIKKENIKAEKFAVKLPDGEVKCTDFFACFDCSDHKIVAGVKDIWLMLSFQHHVLEMKELIAVSSEPMKELYKNEILISKTLCRMKVEAPDNHGEAVMLLDEKGFHPLYRSRQDLKYLLEGVNE
jgi:hypothetical protein